MAITANLSAEYFLAMRSITSGWMKNLIRTFDINQSVLEKIMATIGILMCINAPGEEGEDRIGIEAVDVTAEQALQHVRSAELHNIGFDRQFAVNDNDIESISHFDKLESEAKTLAWPEAVNENGQFVLPSTWAGGLDDDGMEWRFVPVLDVAV